MFYTTGDTHGMLNADKLAKLSHVDPDDYIIICGDAGLFFYGDYRDSRTQDFILDLVPCKILWVDGNHENFDLIDSLPVIDDWNGGKVQIYKDRLIHLMRGEIYEIDNTSFFCFGGGQSIDRKYRVEGQSWWSREMPSQEEYNNGINNLANYDFKVDYIISHTAPRSVCKQLVDSMYPGEEQLQNYLQLISKRTEFKKWFFGHWHIDKQIENFYGLFEDIIQL